MLEEYHYPKERIKVEYAVWFGSGVSDKSADIVVMQTDGEHPYIIFEVKKPKRKDGLQQLKSYCNAEGSPIGVWSNGEELVILHREEPNIFSQISSIPTVDQTLQDVITEQWTIDKLKQENRLVKERLSLKKIILDLEDLVLANAEGIDDSFDEVFKLIYAKLYDEWAAANDRTRNHNSCGKDFGGNYFTKPAFVRELYFYVGGYFGTSHWVYLHEQKFGKILRHVASDSHYIDIKSELADCNISLIPIVHKWAEFNKDLLRCYFIDWKSCYINQNVLDGTQWELNVTFDNGTTIKRYGSNAYPPHWEKLIAAFHKYGLPIIR